jgi:putative Mg2+ transporter-C (MgtC) family protein
MGEWEGLVRVALAAGLGGLIGFERETLNKPAGLRTHMLVSMGSAMFMVASILLVSEINPDGTVGRGDVTRIASTIVTGVGFLGGGIIFRTQDRIQGLTTAAGMWVVSAIGLASGAGLYITAIGGTGLALLVQVVVRRVELFTNNKLLNSDPDAEGS